VNFCIAHILTVHPLGVFVKQFLHIYLITIT
jgi:hypothetical protein